jgi:hypothetical protein
VSSPGARRILAISSLVLNIRTPYSASLGLIVSPFFAALIHCEWEVGSDTSYFSVATGNSRKVDNAASYDFESA